MMPQPQPEPQKKKRGRPRNEISTAKHQNKKRSVKLPLTCERCRHQWKQELLINAPLRILMAWMRTKIHCPRCIGVGYVKIWLGELGTEPKRKKSK